MLYALALVDALVLPIAAIVLGFLVLGYAFPQMLESVTPYGKTIWMPLAFVVAAGAGAYTVFGNRVVEVLLGAPWCGTEPCIHFGLVIVAFVLGSFARFGTMKLAGEDVDLFGEEIDE